MIDLSDLKRKAEAAKRTWPNGTWFTADSSFFNRLELEEREHLAAASPDVILSLIARIEELEKKL